jgi:uncharacterized protein YfaT (DUF1175 family)
VRVPVSLVLVLAVIAAAAAAPRAQVRLADDGDRAAFRAWFVLLAETQFERPAAEVTDGAAIQRASRSSR